MQKPIDSNMLIVILAIIVLGALFGAFRAGISVGYHKADFASRAGEGFYRVFGEDGPRFKAIGGMPELPFFGDAAPGGHGAVGRVVTVSLPTFVVASPDNVERVVRISSTTEIRRARAAVAASSIESGERVIVLGVPGDDGHVEALLIRILDR
jgi:hypothetical protein